MVVNEGLVTMEQMSLVTPQHVLNLAVSSSYTTRVSSSVGVLS